MIKQLRNATAGLVLAALLPVAQAAPVLWTLIGVTFDDASTATGSFIFDADTLMFSSVAITTGAASYDTGEVSPIPFGADALGLELVDGFVPGANSGKPILNLDFTLALTNAGGVVPLVLGFPSFEGECGAADCTSGFVFRQVASGEVVGTAVPEPATLALAGLALLAGARLGSRRRRA